MKNILIGISISAFAFSAHAATSTQPAEFQIEIRNLCTRVFRGYFAQNRNLNMYEHSLGPNFQHSLTTMTDNDLWIDLGAGHAIAMKDYLSKHPNGANVLAISAQKPDDYKSPNSSKFRYFECLLPDCFSALDKEKKATIVTDMLGPAFYSPDLASVVQGSINLLKPGGRYILSADQTIVPSLRQPAFIYGKSGPITFEEYLGLVDGIETLPGDGVTFEIIKRNSIPVRLPKLELFILEDGSPPRRVYQVIEE